MLQINTTRTPRIPKHSLNIRTCIEERNLVTAVTERHFECLSNTVVIEV